MALGSGDSQTNKNGQAHDPAELPWFRKLSRPILFLTISMALVGAYLAFSIPVAVFPNTDFPRIVVGVDNGVMPIDQMLITITRPIEEDVNSVPGLQKVTSITSRGSAEVDLFFNWNSDMILALQRVDAVVARLQAELPGLSHHRLQPYVRYRAAQQALGDRHLRPQATPQPPGWRRDRHHTRRPRSRIPGNPGSRAPARRWDHGDRYPRRHSKNQSHRLARLDRARSSTRIGPHQRAGPHSRTDRANRRQDYLCGSPHTSWGHREYRAFGRPGLYHGDRQRQTRRASQRRSPARKQHPRCSQ